MFCLFTGTQWRFAFFVPFLLSLFSVFFLLYLPICLLLFPLLFLSLAFIYLPFLLPIPIFLSPAPSLSLHTSMLSLLCPSLLLSWGVWMAVDTRGPAGRRLPMVSCLLWWARCAEEFQCRILEVVLLILLSLPYSFIFYFILFFIFRKRSKAESHLIPWTSLQSRYA